MFMKIEKKQGKHVKSILPWWFVVNAQQQKLQFAKMPCSLELELSKKIKISKWVSKKKERKKVFFSSGLTRRPHICPFPDKVFSGCVRLLRVFSGHSLEPLRSLEIIRLNVKKEKHKHGYYHQFCQIEAGRLVANSNQTWLMTWCQYQSSLLICLVILYNIRC